LAPSLGKKRKKKEGGRMIPFTKGKGGKKKLATVNLLPM